MKANEMTERIYLFDYNDAMVTPLEGDTVYVREDAFIEKAKKWIEKQKAQWRLCKSSEAKYRREMLDDILSFIDTLEVKKVSQ